MPIMQTDELLTILQARFDQHMDRHTGLDWIAIQAKLEAQPEKLRSLLEMESTGGEPDVVGFASQAGEYVFFDCSVESPAARRSLCYDRQALEARKEHKPADSALNMASAMGIELLSEQDYRQLQESGKFDLKTSSWVLTPIEIRKHGGAIFCDRRYDHVFTYHNGADSYYASRGFRGKLVV